ncbi:MAG: hypothetical protein AB7S96_03150, partial [Candidatus Izemoplasmatales bacterium]
MVKFPKMKIFDSMVKGNSLLVGLSLFLLLVFIAYISNWFGFSEFVINSDWFFDIRSSSFIKYITVILILIPLLGGIIELLFGERMIKNRDKSVIYMGFFTLILVVFLYPFVLDNTIELNIANIFSLGLSLRIDMLGYTILMLS